MKWLKKMIKKLLNADGSPPVTPQDLVNASRRQSMKNERTQPLKKVQSKDRTQGPAYYLGMQVVRMMEDAGYPSRILYCWRSPQVQNRFYNKGTSKAKAWQSPHQYMEAVDVIHATRGWNVSEDYWDTLAACVRTVSSRFNVQLEHGHNWKFRDSAHFEIKPWREVKGRYQDEKGNNRMPTQIELLERFVEVLPRVQLSKKEKQLLNDGSTSIDQIARQFNK